MSRFGWAYVSSLSTGSSATPGGTDKAIQFNSGSTFSGSSNFTFDYTTNFVSASSDILVGGQVISAGSIRSNGAIKGNYSKNLPFLPPDVKSCYLPAESWPSFN